MPNNKKNQHSHRAAAYAELWMAKFLDFLQDYPPDIRDKWKKSLDIVVKTRVEDDIPYKVLLNPGRVDRLDIKQNKSIGIPGFHESLDRFKGGKRNTVLFAEEIEIDPFFALVNIFPIKEGHSTLVYREVDPVKGVKREITREGLEKALKFSDETECMVWRNMPGAGITIPTWEHYQACSCEPGVRYTRKERVPGYDDVLHMPNYPGSNIVLNGDRKVDRALTLTKKLHARDVAFVIGVDSRYVYIVPVKDEFAGVAFGLSRESRVAGYELITCTYIAVNEDDFKKACDIGAKAILGKTCYPKSELYLPDSL